MKLAALFLLGACSPMHYVHGVPNLVHVDEHLWRGGQPKPGPEGWAYLKSQGVAVVVKLNSEAEGSDAEAITQGLSVVDLSMPPYDGQDPFSAPSPAALAVVEDNIAHWWLSGVYVHCSHGQDRTGVAIWYDCLTRRKLPKRACDRELYANNYHDALLGLERLRFQVLH